MLFLLSLIIVGFFDDYLDDGGALIGWAFVADTILAIFLSN